MKDDGQSKLLGLPVDPKRVLPNRVEALVIRPQLHAAQPQVVYRTLDFVHHVRLVGMHRHEPDDLVRRSRGQGGRGVVDVAPVSEDLNSVVAGSGRDAERERGGDRPHGVKVVVDAVGQPDLPPGTHGRVELQLLIRHDGIVRW